MSSSAWSCVAGLERLAAVDAQPRAVRPAQRGDRLGQDDRVATGRLEVQLVVVGQAQRVGLVVEGRPACRCEVDRRQVLLVGLEVERDLDGLEAAGALARERGRRGPRRRGRRGSCARAGPRPRSARSGRGRRAARSGRRRTAYWRSDPTARPSSPATFQMRGPSVGRAVMGGPAAPRPPARRAQPPRRPTVERRPPRRTRSARRSSSIAMPFLMLWSVLTTSPSRPTSTSTAYSSAPRRISSASCVRLADDRAGPRPRPASVSPRSSIRNAACSWARATIRSASSWAFSMIRSPSALIRLAARTSSGTATRSSSIRSRAASWSTTTFVVRGSFLPFAICDSSRSTRNMMSIGVPSWLGGWSPGTRGRKYGTRACRQRLGERLGEGRPGGGRDHRRDVAAEARRSP